MAPPLATSAAPGLDNLSRPRSYPLQRSTSDYPVSTQSSAPFYNAFPNSSTSQLPNPPPSYFHDNDDPASDFKLPPPRFAIHPREEEGREQLPPYSCTIAASGVFGMKMELNGPFERCEERMWTKVYVELQGTMLNVHRIKYPSLFSTRPNPYLDTNPDKPLGQSAGPLVRSYTLQHAEVGVAADYRKLTSVPFSSLWRLLRMGDVADVRTPKRSFVIRMRAEGEQFLLSCITVDTFLSFLESLSTAIDLAPPLDERSLPRYQTIPRRRRRRPRDMLREQQRIIQEQFPNLEATPENAAEATVGIGVLEAQEPAEDGAQTEAEIESETAVEQGSAEQPRGRQNSTTSNTSSPFSARRSPTLTPRPRSPSVDSVASIDGADGHQSEGSDSASSTGRGPSNDSSNDLPPSSPTSSGEVEALNDEDLKWSPSHQCNLAADIRRRRRCQRVLVSDEPRLSDIVIRDGKRWRVDIREKKLVEWSANHHGLPSYEGSTTEIDTRWRQRGLPEQGF